MKKLILASLAGVFVLAACNDAVNELKESITSAEDNAAVESQLAGVFEVLDDVASSDSKMNKTSGTILPSGATLEYIDSLFTDGDGLDFYIDFGPKGDLAPFGLLCQDGRYRSGILRGTLSKPYKEVGAILEITLAEADSFFSGNGTDMYMITGTHTITRTAVDKATVAVRNVKVRDGSATIKWQSDKEITRTKDSGPGIWKDEFEITGQGNGTNRNGEDFTVTITEPLKKIVDAGCAKTFVKGVITLEVTSSNKKIIVDYDPYKNEACDNIAEADINGRKTIFRVK